MRRCRTPLLIAVAAIAFASLACERLEELLPGEEGRPPEYLAPPMPQYDAATSCLGSLYLVVDAAILKDEVNQLGTRECRYKLTITNTHAEFSIWPFVYNWHEDGYQNIKEGQWLQLIKLAPGESLEWFGNYTTYTDPDASGPLVTEAQRIVGVYDSPECQTLISDSGTLETLSSFRPDDPCSPVK